MTNVLHLEQTKVFLKSDDKYRLGELPNFDNIIEKLPAGIYEYVKVESMFGTSTYFKQKENFKLPSRLYGDLVARASRVITAYDNIEGNLGALFVGNSGSGKSLLAKYIANQVIAEKNMPVIVLDKKSISDFKDIAEMFLLINQEVLFFIDEFEKLWIKEDEDHDDNSAKIRQNYLLSLLDGVIPSHNMILLTANDYNGINKFMLNRPSRLRYCFKYGRLSDEFIREVLEDRLNDKSIVSKLLLELRMVSDLSFDILVEIVNEINLFPDYDFKELMTGLNIEYIDPRMVVAYNWETYFTEDIDNLENSKTVMEITASRIRELFEEYGISSKVELKTNYKHDSEQFKSKYFKCLTDKIENTNPFFVNKYIVKFIFNDNPYTFTESDAIIYRNLEPKDDLVLAHGKIEVARRNDNIYTEVFSGVSSVVDDLVDDKAIVKEIKERLNSLYNELNNAPVVTVYKPNYGY